MEKKGLGDKLKDSNINQGHKISWVDEMRLGLISQVRRVWSPIGVKIVQKVQLTYSYCYLHLAVDGLSGTLTWIWAENMKSESVIKAVEACQKANIDVIVWDGASSHRAHRVQKLDPTLIIQPPYSPELNPAERIFEAIRAEIEGIIYETIADKQKAVEKYLIALTATPEKIKELAGWAWIEDTISPLPNPVTN